MSHDLSTLPHLIVAGATGGGKTMFLRCMITSLVLRWEPRELQLLLIDLKSVDFTAFARLPHLRCGGIVTAPYDAIEALHALTDEELPRRTRLLRDAACPNFRDLAARDQECAAAPIVVIIDEFADLICVLDRHQRDDLERVVLRLAQRARAVGIYLVLATQRPSTEFISGSIKANFPCRVSFRLPQRLDSLVVLDQIGAEKLLGAGDMLLLHDGRLHRLQGYYVTVDEEVQLLTRKYPALVRPTPDPCPEGDHY
jgi:S-DNA-T family DNA segregation ATPase FtsK/SpoIIIE